MQRVEAEARFEGHGGASAITCIFFLNKCIGYAPSFLIKVMIRNCKFYLCALTISTKPFVKIKKTNRGAFPKNNYGRKFCPYP